MTAPNDEPGFLLKLIFEKVNGIDQKIDGHSEKLANHEVRLSTVETGKKDNRAVWLAFAVAAAAWVPDLLHLTGK